MIVRASAVRHAPTIFVKGRKGEEQGEREREREKQSERHNEGIVLSLAVHILLSHRLLDD